MNEIPELAALAAIVDSPEYDHDEQMARYRKMEEIAAASNRVLGEALHEELLRAEAAHRRKQFSIETTATLVLDQ